MGDRLDQILAIIRSVMDDEEKLEKILDFLETEIHESEDMLKPESYELEEDFFPEIDIPEKYKSVINSIAQDIDAGMVCVLNPDTLETDAYPMEIFSDIDALSRRKPFANFNHIIHNSDWLQAWYDFKQKWMENEVATQLKGELEYLANLPEFEGGIYNDDGTKVDESTIPVPNLCVVCKKHHSDDWEEDILCKLNRNDQRDDLDNFECGAFEKI